MVKRIAIRALECAATGAFMALVYFIAETPLRFAEYRMMGGGRNG
jgi:hypothetical protein